MYQAFQIPETQKHKPLKSKSYWWIEAMRIYQVYDTSKRSDEKQPNQYIDVYSV